MMRRFLVTIVLACLAVTVMASCSSDSSGSPDQGGSDLGEPEPEGGWHDAAVFYEIFVRSFYDSDGDGVGDLRGVIERLDYLNDGAPGEGDDLEVDAIWLMPIFESPSYHGYDVTDYYAVDPDYGTEADLLDLIDACHERGVRVVLDMAMNHTSSQHPWFVDSRSGQDAELRDYYVWRSEDPGWTQPWSDNAAWHPSGGWYYYGVFWGGMPDLNYWDDRVVDDMTEVVTYWAEQGADGFRFDAVRYLIESQDGDQQDLPETHAFFRALRTDLEGVASGIYMVGEAYGPRPIVTTYYGAGDEFHQAFDFDLAAAVEEALIRRDPDLLSSELDRLNSAYAPGSFAATFLTNHDLDRVARRLPADWQQRAAATVLFTLPGSPYIYYGDEIGMAQGSGHGDEAKRTPMAWDATSHGGFTTGEPWYPLSSGYGDRNVATELADETSLLWHYRRLVQLRHEHAAIGVADGLATLEPAAEGLFATLRYDDESVFLVEVNFTGGDVEPGTIDLSAHSDILGEGPWQVDIVFGESDPIGAAADITDFPLGSTMGAGEGRVLSIE